MNLESTIIENEVTQMLSSLVEEKDSYTAGHSKRVAMYSVKLAEALALSEEEQKTIYRAGLLHDIGKVLTPESILLKPKRFNRHEYEIIKRHSTDSERMVGAISVFQPYAKIIRHHHERFDGKGYPDGLMGEAIPKLSRIIAVADAFDAMTTSRIYKARKDIAQAVKELKAKAGTQFDPWVVEKAEAVFTQMREMVHIAQLPETFSLEEERFAYYFKDPLTGVFSAEYLNYFLQNNQESERFKCCYMVQIHHMGKYNEQFGWKMGDEALREIALRLKVLFKSSYIFRIFGDDFIVLNPLHVEIDAAEILYKMVVGFSPLKVHFEHFDLSKEQFFKWDNLENHLLPSMEDER